jgi:hypothetical protein
MFVLCSMTKWECSRMDSKKERDAILVRRFSRTLKMEFAVKRNVLNLNWLLVKLICLHLLTLFFTLFLYFIKLSKLSQQFLHIALVYYFIYQAYQQVSGLFTQVL